MLVTRRILIIGGTLVSWCGVPVLADAQTVQPCADANQCIQVTVTGGSAQPGGTTTVGLTFQPGPKDSQTGGTDEIAALTLTLALGDGSGMPLTLADCSINVPGLPNAITPDPSIVDDFNVRVVNLVCGGTQTHCLCPDPGSGVPPDNFIDLAIYGPKRLPTPGIDPLRIPILPAARLLSIDLKTAPDAGGTIPLHIFNRWQDSQHPQRAAFVSVSDTLAVDQTCVPVAGGSPCSGAGAVSQVVVSDASIIIVPTPTFTATRTHTETPTAAPSSTATRTPTASVSPTQTPPLTATRTGSATVTATRTVSPTVTVSATARPVATATHTVTATLTATHTATATLTATRTVSPTATVSATASPVATATHTVTATLTATGTAGATLTATATVSPTFTATSVASATQTAAATETPTAITTPTNTSTVGPTATGTVVICVGDCDGSQTVTVNEIVLLTDIALGNADPSACPKGVASGEQVDVSVIIQAVNKALDGCAPL